MIDRRFMTRRDQLRFDAAISHTVVTLRKWSQLAYGVDKLDSVELAEFCAEIHNELTTALLRQNVNHGT